MSDLLKCYLAPTGNAALFDFEAGLTLQIAWPNVERDMDSLGVSARTEMERYPILGSKNPITEVGLHKT